MAFLVIFRMAFMTFNESIIFFFNKSPKEKTSKKWLWKNGWTYMHLLQTSPNSIANSSICREDDDGLVWDSDGFDLLPSFDSSSSSLEFSSFTLSESFSSEWGFFFLVISSSSSLFTVVPDLRRFAGGGFALVIDVADRFFYKHKRRKYREDQNGKRDLQVMVEEMCISSVDQISNPRKRILVNWSSVI